MPGRLGVGWCDKLAPHRHEQVSHLHWEAIMTLWEQLFAHRYVRGDRPLRPVELAAACLEVTQAKQDALRRFQAQPSKEDSLRELGQWVADRTRDILSRDWLRDVQAHLHAQPLPAVAAIRALAEGLDAAQGSGLLRLRRAPGRHELQAGEAISRGGLVYSRLWSPSLLSTRPASLGPTRHYLGPDGSAVRISTAPTRLRSLSIVPSGDRFVLHCPRRLAFSPDKSLRIAFALPNRDIPADFKWRTGEAGNQPFFEDVTPRRPTEQGERIRKLVKLAKAATAATGEEDALPDVLVFPELSTRPELATELLSSARPIPLVLAGSYHHEGRNTAPFRLAPDVSGVHHKRNRFEDAALGIERVQTGQSLHLLSVGDWLICPLICKDLLDSSTLMNLAQVGCNLVLVAALTSRTDPFESAASLIGTHLQGVTAICNAAIPPDAAPPAIVAVPMRDTRRRLSQPKDASRCGVWTADIGEKVGSVRWTFAPLE